MNKPKIDIHEVTNFIQKQPRDSKIYIGCDSNTFKRRDGKWFADYITVVVVHMACPDIPGRMVGGKIFGELVTEPDYSHTQGNPNMRLINEVSKAAELFQKLSPAIGSRPVEIHLDINQDPLHASHAVAQQAIGYIRGVCGIEPKIKPDAMAASYCADRFMRVKDYDLTKTDNTKKHYLKRKS